MVEEGGELEVDEAAAQLNPTDAMQGSQLKLVQSCSYPTDDSLKFSDI